MAKCSAGEPTALLSALYLSEVGQVKTRFGRTKWTLHTEARLFRRRKPYRAPKITPDGNVSCHQPAA